MKSALMTVNRGMSKEKYDLFTKKKILFTLRKTEIIIFEGNKKKSKNNTLRKIAPTLIKIILV
jgi:bisphosphoglycerate-independent phosphoglycerate mutase (AlkP superfamily)